MLVIVSRIKFLLNPLDNIRKVTNFIWNKEQYVTNLFYICIEIKKAIVKLLIVTIALVGIAVMLLGVRIFFVKGGKFPDTHIHSNKHMRKMGITCAQDKDFNK